MTKLWRVAVLLPALGLVAVGSGFAGWSSVMIGAVVGVTGAVALLVLRRHPTHRIGWLLAVQSCLVAAMAPGGGGDNQWTFVAGLLLTALTGWLQETDRFWGEEWVQRLHEVAADTVMVAVALHVAAVLLMQRLSGKPLLRAMFRG